MTARSEKRRMLPAPLTVRVHRLLQALRQRRLELGLSQDVAAGQMGMKQRNLSDWERRIYTPRLDSLLKWCAVLDMDVCFVRSETVRFFAKADGVTAKRRTGPRGIRRVA